MQSSSNASPALPQIVSSSGVSQKKVSSSGGASAATVLPNAARSSFLQQQSTRLSGYSSGSHGSASKQRPAGPSSRATGHDGNAMDESVDSPASVYHSVSAYQSPHHSQLGAVQNSAVYTNSPNSQQGRPAPIAPLPLGQLGVGVSTAAVASARASKSTVAADPSHNSQTTRDRMQAEKDAERARMEREKAIEKNAAAAGVVSQFKAGSTNSPHSHNQRQPVPPAMPSPASHYQSAQQHAHSAIQPMSQGVANGYPTQSPSLQQQQLQQQYMLQQQQLQLQQQQQQAAAAAAAQQQQLAAQQVAQQAAVTSARVIPKPKPAMTPAETMKRFGELLTPFEQSEILEYQQIYFVGNSLKDKIKGIPHTALNNGYDDERGDYKISMGDHLEYRYEVLHVLGRGSFGQVLKVFDHKKDMPVALKIIRNKKRFHHQALVEVKILEHLMGRDREHKSNIVRVHGYFYFRNHLCITFEPLSINLYEFIKNNNFKGISLGLIRRFALQLLQSLRFLKGERIIHCDLKPENILLKSSNKSSIRLIDFGSSCFEDERVYTYIQSRFYRSPEVILGLPYDIAIDMWSFGCILSELYTGYPLFPGENETEQIQCIMEILGPPPKRLVQECTRKKAFFDATGKPLVVPNSRGKIRQPGSKDLAMATKCNDPQFLSFLRRCLRWDPKVRMTPEKAFEHPWINESLRPKDASPSLTQLSGMASAAATPTQISQVGYASVSMQQAQTSRVEKTTGGSTTQRGPVASSPQVNEAHFNTDSPSSARKTSLNKNPQQSVSGVQPSTARRPSISGNSSSLTKSSAQTSSMFPPISSNQPSSVNNPPASSRATTSYQAGQDQPMDTSS